MGTFTLYILSWAFCLTLLMAVYKVFLCGTTFHRFNRFLLLGFLVLSAVLPLCHLEMDFDSISISETEFARTLETFHYDNDETAVKMADVAEASNSSNGETANPLWPYLLIGVYMFYVLIILSGWIRSTFKMRRFLHACRRYRLGKWVRLAVHTNLFGPFNWMNYIVVPDEERSLHSDVAVCHELAHVRCLHCIDLLVVGVCALVNPVAWLLLRELKSLHEYEADDHVLRNGRLEAKTYQLLLIKKSVGAEAYALASCLNFNLKNRIIMMKKQETNRWRKAWMLAAVPVAGLALAVFAVPANEVKAENFAADISAASFANADIPILADASRAVNIYVDKEGEVYCSVGGKKFFKHDKSLIDIELDDIVAQGVMEAYENGVPTTVHITCEEGTGTEIYKSAHSQVRAALTLTKSKVDNPDKIDDRIAVHNNEYRSQTASRTSAQSPVAVNDSIHNMCEVMPSFPGGESALMQFIMNNVKFPQECNAVDGFTTRVLVQFVVGKDGSITDSKIFKHMMTTKETPENKSALKHAKEAAEKEALRVVGSMPKWTPGMIKGKAVSCRYTIPMIFRTK